MFAALVRWVDAGWLRELDRSFAAFLSRMAPEADPLVILAAAWASHQLGRGHSCLDLQAACQDAGLTLALPPEGLAFAATEEAPPDAPAMLLASVGFERWQAALDAAPLLVGTGQGSTPLVRVGTRLYLRRYWHYEQQVRQQVARRVSTRTAAAEEAALPLLAAALDALFDPAAGQRMDWQKAACALAARQAFSIITGGPGTGKTTTVVRLLAVLQYMAMAQGGRRLRIGLAAPTGKAAARLSESIAGAVQKLPLDRLPNVDAAGAEELRAAIPTSVGTVHRLLGSRPDTRRFRHDALNPLPLDLLVLDEASMLDLEMMANVLAALPEEAPLILLGDKDQLASVEAGAVLGDLCRRADAGHYTPQTAAWLRSATGQSIDDALLDPQGQPLDQAVAKLRVSWRFGADSGIGQLADAVNAGRSERVRDVLQSGFSDLRHLDPASDDAAFARLVVDGGDDDFAWRAKGRMVQGQPVPPPVGHGHYLQRMRDTQPPIDAPQAAFDGWAHGVLGALGGFQLLCALRRGPQGVEALNTRIARLLRARGLIEGDASGWYAGRPVMVTRNDYGLDLRNGDVGVTLAVPDRRGVASTGAAWRLRVAFAAPELPGGVRWVLPSRLRDVETVFAMTVHKSQGSEFSHAALLLPEQPSPVVTRELLYTGITRARHWFTLLASPQAVRAASERAVQRVGGL
nr:exodeoxyribonuclease V subunit alpha [Variovorax dokdonensis]